MINPGAVYQLQNMTGQPMVGAPITDFIAAKEVAQSIANATGQQIAIMKIELVHQTINLGPPRPKLVV